ncbi:MAG: hypothetical protein PVG91_05400, partial [Gammaproteobacteria bacterium]
MSIVAQGTPEDVKGLSTPRAGPLGLLLHPVALGTLLGALLAVFLSHWFLSQARTELAEDRWNRDVIIELSALADTVAALEARDKDASPQEIEQILPKIAAATGDEIDIRVLRLSGARLLASTDARDSAEKPLPRRLARNEKWLFDLAQGIRASVETNRDEGVSRRRQIEIEDLGDNRLRITAPYFVDDAVAGVVQTERLRPRMTAGAPLGFALLMALLPYLVAVGLLAAAGPERRQKDVAETKPWGLFLGSALALTIAVGVYGIQGIGAVGELQAGLAQQLGEEMVEMRDLVGRLAGGTGVTVSPGPENRWDVDLYQRPMGLIDGEGAVVPE